MPIPADVDTYLGLIAAPKPPTVVEILAKARYTPGAQ
jgi:hypothetical protein